MINFLSYFLCFNIAKYLFIIFVLNYFVLFHRKLINHINEKLDEKLKL